MSLWAFLLIKLEEKKKLQKKRGERERGRNLENKRAKRKRERGRNLENKKAERDRERP